MTYNPRFFADWEFQCPCGCGTGRERMQTDLLRPLDHARELADVPFTLTSAARCEAHNADVGGVDSSAHVRGYAVDIACRSSRERKKILSALLAAGFTRIGVAKTFIHADRDPGKPGDVIWTY